MMWLRDTGILNKLKYDVMNPPIPIPDAKVRHNQPLNLRQLGISVIILVVGLFIALILFLVELCNKKKTRDISDANEHFEISERTIAWEDHHKFDPKIKITITDHGDNPCCRPPHSAHAVSWRAVE